MSNNNDDDNTNDNSNDGKLKIVFAEGCFDNFEGSQEELDELVATLQEMANDGSLFEEAVEVSLADMVSEIVAGAQQDGMLPDDVLKAILAQTLEDTGEDFDIDPEVMDLSRMIPPSNTRQ